MGQHHDSALSLDYTVISIDSPHMRKDGSNYLKFLLKEEFHSDCKTRTALLLKTEMKILRAGKLSPLFHEVTVT